MVSNYEIFIWHCIYLPSVMMSDLPYCAAPESALGATFSAAMQFFAAAHCLLDEPWPKQARVKMGARFDFIIIGGGTAGATLAARLSEEPNFKVLLVEAGANPPQESIVPGFKDFIRDSTYDWQFTSTNDHFSSQALQGGSQRQPRGKMLGGTGSINDMIYARGFPSDYEEWADLVGPEWHWETVLEYFKKTEHLTDERIIDDPTLFPYHRTGGEIEVSGSNLSTTTTEIFLEVFRELGFDTVKDMTYPKYGLQRYAGEFSYTINKGRRHSSLTALLNKASERANLHVLKNALVTKIVIDNGHAVGIKVLFKGEQLSLYATQEVVLSAGTFNTPKILLLSGIGPREHLREFGIPVHQDLPVGENLHDHVMVYNYVAAQNGTCSDNESSYIYMNMMQYLYNRTGIFSQTHSLAAYISNNAPYDAPDFAIYPVCIPYNSSFYEPCFDILGFNDEMCGMLDEVNKNHELLSLGVVLLKPKSRGRVKLQSADPLVAPLIYSGTFSDFSDIQGFPEALSAARSITKTKYFLKKNAHVIEFQPKQCDGISDNTARLECMAKHEATPAWHAVGTAAMGSVVDAKLRVYGINGLRVADASVMPKVIRGHTNAAVVMIAERAVDFIMEEQHKTRK